MRFAQILNEHNIINLPDLEQWVERMAERCDFPEGKDWIRTRFRKFLINSDNTADLVSQLSPNAPEWMQKRIADNVPLHRFRPNDETTNQLSHVVDWLNSVNAYAGAGDEIEDKTLVHEAKLALPKLMKISIEQAMVMTEKWFDRVHHSVDTEKLRQSKDGLSLALKTPVGDWMEILSNEAKSYEGSAMGHCVGGGSYKLVEDGGRYRIFSLRDKRNEPHVTVSLVKDFGDTFKLDQIKGKQNETPVPKYHDAVVELLNLLHPTGDDNRDLKRMGIHYKDGKYGGIHQVADKVAEIDGVSVYRMDKSHSSTSWPDPYYYFYHKRLFAEVQLTPDKYGHEGKPTVSELKEVKLIDCKKDGVRNAVWKVIAQFLNSLDPVPQPYSSCSPPTGMKYLLFRNGVYGESRDKLSWEVGHLAYGWRVMELETYKTKVIDVWDDKDQHRLTIEQMKGSKGWGKDERPTYRLSARRVDDVPPPDAGTIIDAILLADLKGHPDKSLRNLGVWPKDFNKHIEHGDDHVEDHVAMRPFDPEAHQMVKITDDLFGGSRQKDARGYKDKSPLKAYLYSAEGKKVAEVQLLEAKSQNMRGIVDNAWAPHTETYSAAENEKFREHVEKALQSHPKELAEWFNKIGFEAPTRDYQREQMRQYHIVMTKGKWQAVTDSEVIGEYDGYTIKKVSKSLTVTSPKGEVVLLANKGREKYEGVKLTKVEGGTKTRQNAILALDYYLEDNDKEWKVDSDQDDFCRAELVQVDGRMKPVDEVHPPRTIKDYGDMMWQERYLVWCDSHMAKDREWSWGWANPAKYSLIDDSGQLARVYTKNKEIRLIIIRDAEDKKIKGATSDTIVGILPQLTDLMRAENLTYSREYFGRTLNVAIVNGEARPLSDDKRLQEFLRGQVTYEDGKRWQKAQYEKGFNWELVRDTPLESDPTKTTVEKLVLVNIDHDGLDQVKMRKNQKNPREFLGYIMDLVELAHGKND